MTTESSLSAYKSTTNKQKRETIRKQCYDALKKEPMTAREVARKTGLTYNQVYKRMSELHLSRYVKVIGERIENGNKNSVYAINNVVPLFEVPYITFKQWVKTNHPSVYTEWIKLKQ